MTLAQLEEEFLGRNTWIIGLTDQGHEGRWIWQHSVLEASYFEWADGYPQSNNSEHDCVVMSPDNSYSWMDVRSYNIEMSTNF